MGCKVKFEILDNDATNAIPHSEMPDFYKRIDVLICTSMFEGCPLPVLEAASSGKPVISTRVGIVPELIKHGENGFIVDTPHKCSEIEKTIKQFEEHIMALKYNRSMCADMGFKNREAVVREFDWGKIIPLWEKFFSGA